MRRTFLHIFLLALLAGHFACGPRSGTGVGQAPDDTASADTAFLNLYTERFSKGNRLFETHCRICHSPPHEWVTCNTHTFEGYWERVPKPAETYFIKYISDSKAIKATGDPYAIKIDREFQNDYEHAFKDSLSEKDLQDLIFYIKLGTKLKHLN